MFTSIAGQLGADPDRPTFLSGEFFLRISVFCFARIHFPRKISNARHTMSESEAWDDRHSSHPCNFNLSLNFLPFFLYLYETKNTSSVFLCSNSIENIHFVSLPFPGFRASHPKKSHFFEIRKKRPKIGKKGKLDVVFRSKRVSTYRRISQKFRLFWVGRRKTWEGHATI